MSDVERLTKQDVIDSPRLGFWVHAGDFNQKIEQGQRREAELQQRLTAADERADVLSPGSALGDVHIERLRQIDVENRSPVDDDDYSLGQLAYAASGYAQGSVPAQQVQGCLRPSYWPWHPRWWKPGSPRRMLVKAGALILAEIERIDRLASKP